MEETFIQVYSSPLGLLQVRSNGKGITAISFKETVDKTEHPLPLIDSAIKQLDEYFEGKRTSFDFPLAQQGTSFQMNVWNYLIQIPFGKTISYLQLSKQIGDVKAIRAIASANG